MFHEPTSSNPSQASLRPINDEFISVGEALKLVPYFKGDRQEVLAFIGNVDMAFSIINPLQENVLYKFVLTRISGEPRTAICHRNLENWGELKEFLRNSYIEKRTLDFHANQLFKDRQGKDDKVAGWIQRVQTLGSHFRESALLDCSEGAREDLADRLQNICFVQGLASDRIQTIVRSRNYRNFDEIAETALVEESVITSKHDRYTSEGGNSLRCSTCGKMGHSSSKCFSRVKREPRVNPVVTSVSEGSRQVTCFRCGEKGHFARQCRKPPKTGGRVRGRKQPGNEVRRPESNRPTVSSTQ
jgi:hypothetical protein